MFGNFVIIISMHGLAKFQHNIVGNVNYIADRTYTAGTQTFLHPFGRRSHFNIFQHANGKTFAQIRRFNFNICHSSSIAAGSFLDLHSRHFQRAACYCGNLARQTDNTEAVGTVGSQININNRIIQAQYFFNIHTNRSIRRQDKNTISLLGQQQFAVNAQFFGAAQHAERIQTAHSGFFQLHAVRQTAAHNGNGHHIILMYVLCAG